MRGAVTQSLQRHLTKHAEDPMGATAPLQLEAVRRAAARMLHRKGLFLTHTEQLTDPSVGEHMLRHIHYHAVDDPRGPLTCSLPHTHTPSPSSGLEDTTRTPQKNTHRKTPLPQPRETPQDQARLTNGTTRHRPAHPSPPKTTHTSNVDALDLDSPPSQTPPDQGHPPLIPATISDPDLLRAALQGSALDTPLRWYRLQESWTKLTVKALGDVAIPGQGLLEAIVDLFLWRARQRTQGWRTWVPPIKWGQALTQDTDTNVTHPGTTRLRRAPAVKDHLADLSRLEHGSRPPHQSATLPSAPIASAAPMTTSPPPPTDSDHPPPEVWCTVLERGHYYVLATTATSPGPQTGHQGAQHHARPRDGPTRGNKSPHHPAQGPEGRPPAGGPSPGPRPGRNQLAVGGLPPGTGHALPVPVDQAPLAVHRDRALDLGHPHRPHKSRGSPNTRKDPPRRPQCSLTCGYKRHPQGPPPHGP